MLFMIQNYTEKESYLMLPHHTKISRIYNCEISIEHT